MWHTHAQLIHDREQFLAREAEFRRMMELSGIRERRKPSARRWLRLWPRTAPVTPRAA